MFEVVTKVRFLSRERACRLRGSVHPGYKNTWRVPEEAQHHKQRLYGVRQCNCTVVPHGISTKVQLKDGVVRLVSCCGIARTAQRTRRGNDTPSQAMHRDYPRFVHVHPSIRWAKICT